MITEDQLKKIEVRLNNAAPGPYRRGIGDESRIIFDANGCMITTDCARSTGTLFAESWRDMRMLVAEVRRLREVLGE
jgi:hypothetical protein